MKIRWLEFDVFKNRQIEENTPLKHIKLMPALCRGRFLALGL